MNTQRKHTFRNIRRQFTTSLQTRNALILEAHTGASQIEARVSQARRPQPAWETVHVHFQEMRKKWFDGYVIKHPSILFFSFFSQKHVLTSWLLLALNEKKNIATFLDGKWFLLSFRSDALRRAVFKKPTDIAKPTVTRFLSISCNAHRPLSSARLFVCLFVYVCVRACVWDVIEWDSLSHKKRKSNMPLYIHYSATETQRPTQTDTWKYGTARQKKRRRKKQQHLKKAIFVSSKRPPSSCHATTRQVSLATLVGRTFDAHVFFLFRFVVFLLPLHFLG